MLIPERFLQLLSGLWEAFPAQPPFKHHLVTHQLPCERQASSSCTYIFLHFSGFLYKNKVISHSRHQFKLGYKVRWTTVIAQIDYLQGDHSLKKTNKQKKQTKTRREEMLQPLLGLMQTNKYASTSVYICLAANEMRSSEMCAEGKALAGGTLMAIDERGQWNEHERIRRVDLSMGGADCGWCQRWRRQVAMAITAPGDDTTSTLLLCVCVCVKSASSACVWAENQIQTSGRPLLFDSEALVEWACQHYKLHLVFLFLLSYTSLHPISVSALYK